ncbi:hypothetical protein EDD18DRAFT_1359541 [Armillaria luteobubalina]|uniref:Uncharacterized protein n=1 Tax=Armillaria luteobubalina TaxID=153913 RepID=A0AA39PS66_9AGAR|nr:hypothetical protein EDD18DRAFT_1359541 [Armillaria luteobubalina]
MPKGKKSWQSHHVLPLYTEEQHCFLCKSAIFHNKAMKNGGVTAEQRYLAKFYRDWFEKFPEDARLTRFELEATHHWWQQDLLRMLWWSYWMWPQGSELYLESDALMPPPAESSYHAQIHLAEEAKVDDNVHHCTTWRAAVTDPAKTATFHTALEALIPAKHDDDHLEDSDDAPFDLTDDMHIVCLPLDFAILYKIYASQN